MKKSHIKIEDIKILFKSVQIPNFQNKKDIESLYFSLVEEMELLGWTIDIWDFEYLGFFTAGFSRSTCSKIINNPLEEQKFKIDLVNCINKLLI